MKEHTPVMLEESLAIFRGRELRSFFDGTVGAGGFAHALLEEHPEIERYYACDRDVEALEIAKARLSSFEGRVHFIHSSFAHLDVELKERGEAPLAGFFFDLGVSSMQLDKKERGFSFLRKGALDMRMDCTQRLTAREVVNHFSEKELGALFRDYGEERAWRRAARAIVEARRKKPIETTTELAAILTAAGIGSKSKLHGATQVFQALRIYVNRELKEVEEGVSKAIELLAPEGRIGVLSFHRLEDRIVKNLFRTAARPLKRIVGMKESPIAPLLKLLTKKPLIPSKQEVFRNRRARSAKLRAAERA